MRPAIRRRLGTAFIALACLAIPLLLGWFPQEPLRAPAERLAGELLGARVSIGELTLTPGLLRLRAARVRAAAPGWEVEAEAIEIALAASVVFGGKPSLRSVTVVSPRVVLTGAREIQAGGADGTESVRIESLLISDAELRTTMESGDFAVRALSARGAIGTGAPLEIEGSLLSEDRLPALRFRSTLAVASDLTIEVRAGRIETGASHLDLVGFLGGMDLASVDLSFETLIGREDLPVGLGGRSAGWEGHGSLRSDSGGLSVKAEVGVVDATGRLEINGSWKDRALDARIVVRDIDPRALVGGDLHSPAPDRLSGFVRLAGPETGPLDVEVELQAARGEGVRYSLKSVLDGSIEPEKPSVEMAWRVAGATRDGVPPWLGPVSLEARGTADGVLPPRIQAQLALRTTTSAAATPLALELDGTIVNRGTLSSLRGELLASDGSTGNFLLDLDGDVARELSGQVNRVPLASWLPDVAGTAAGRVKLAGPLDALSGTADLDVEEIGLAGFDVGAASAAVELAPGRYGAVVSIPALKIDSQLLLADGARLEGELSLRETPLREILSASGLPAESGTITGAFDFDLPIADPKTGRVSGRVEQATWRHGDLDVALTRPLGVDLSDGILALEGLALEGTGARLEGSARVDLVSGSLKGDLSLWQAPLSELLGAVGLPAEDGTVSGAFDFDLPIANPVAGSVSGHIGQATWRHGDLNVALTRPLGVDLKAGILALEGLALEGPGAHMEGSGRVDLIEGDVDASLELDADLAALAMEGVTGDISADVVIRGSLAAPDPEGEVRVANLTTGAQLPWPVRIVRGRLRVAQGVLEIEPTEVSLAGGSVRLAGRGSLAALLERDAAGAHLEIEWQQVDLGQLLAQGPETSAIGGVVSGRAVLDGDPARPGSLTGNVSVPGFTVSIQERPFDMASFSLEVREGVFSTDGLRIASDAGSVMVSGSIDTATQELEITARGDLEPRILSLFAPAVAVSGRAKTDLRVTGSWAAPEISGQLSLSEGAIRLRELPVAIVDVNGSLTLTGDRVSIDSFTGTIGGGSVTLRGGAAIRGRGLGDVDVAIGGDGVGLAYPLGLRSRLDLDMSLRGEPGRLLLSGRSSVTSATFDLAAAESATTGPVESPLLRGIALDIDVVTLAPVRVRHELAQLQATGRLDIRGDLERPQPFGRFEARSGGRVELGGQKFALESGNVTYGGSWDPVLSGTATTRLVDNSSGYVHEVSLMATGTLEQPGVSFTSAPSLSMPQIVALMTTGSAQSQLGDTQAFAAGQGAASLLLSRLGSGAGGGLSGFGIDEVTIQPELGLRELRPGARFTFAKRLNPKLRLLYSVSLEGPEARFFEVEVGPHRGFSGRAQRRDDGSFTLGAGQRIYFGGGKTLGGGTEREVRLRSVEFAGDLPIPEVDLLAAARIRPGRLLDRWGLEDAATRVQRRLVSEGHIEAAVGGRLDEAEGIAQLSVSAGPRYTWRVDGMTAPPDLTSVVLGSLDEDEALEAGRNELFDELWRRGHPFASISARRSGGAQLVELSFGVSPGKRVGNVELRFPGARVLSKRALVEACGAAHRAVSDEASCRAGIESAYRNAHHLRATIGPARIADSESGVTVSMPIDEGARARLIDVAFRTSDGERLDLAAVARLSPGGLIDQPGVEAGARRIREHFYALGHPSVRVVPHLSNDDGDYRLEFEVDQGPGARVESIQLSGLERTRKGVVHSRLTLAPGDPLDPREIARSERKLIETGLFSRAAISAEGGTGRLAVELVERPRYAVGYDLRYNSDKGPSVLVEGEIGQLLGRGLAIGARGQLARDLEEVRGSLSLPLSVGGILTLELSRLDETIEAEFGDEIIENERNQRQVQLRHGLAIGEGLGLTYGYRFKRAHFVSPALGLETEEDVAALDVALLRDTRDDLLDPRAGSFMTLNLNFAPSLLGATFQYIKGYARASFAKPLTDSLTWAQGYSLGLGTGLGGEPIVSTERFRAGGANSLRGFDEGGAGPIGPGGNPLGGEAVVVINQELRLRHAATGLGLGAFYDVGNVFPTAADMSLNLRHTLGAGVRYTSPVGLLRLDLGWLVDAEEDEPRTRWHFSIGQAF